uniref:Transposase n=1 Tax=Ditylenchus dipsaci TaxID=166011 RepID=A0A915CM33_9BILA
MCSSHLLPAGVSSAEIERSDSSSETDIMDIEQELALIVTAREAMAGFNVFQSYVEQSFKDPDMGRTLVDEVERPDVAALRLKDVLNYDTKQALSFFVGFEILKNEKPCDICGAAMLTEKRKERVDGIQVFQFTLLTSLKSIRFGTFFARSQLPLETWLLIFYMWANDYSNKQIVKETGLPAPTMCDWLNFCREVCQNYCHNQRMLGEMDGMSK